MSQNIREKSKETADMTTPRCGYGSYCRYEKTARGIWKTSRESRLKVAYRLNMARTGEAGEWEGVVELSRHRN